jgi:hypothetical protein
MYNMYFIFLIQDINIVEKCTLEDKRGDCALLDPVAFAGRPHNLMMEAAGLSECRETSTRPHGVTSQKRVIFIVNAVKNSCHTKWT